MSTINLCVRGVANRVVSLLVGTHREGKRKFVHDRRVRPHGATRGSPREDGCPSLAAVKVTCIGQRGLVDAYQLADSSCA